MTRSRLGLMVLAVLALVAGPLAARAYAELPPGLPVAVTAVSLPGAALTGYATPVVLTEMNLKVQYANLDIVEHDFVQDVRADGFGGPKNRPWCKEFKKGKCPLFWTKLVGVGQVAGVQGLSAAGAGKTYSFYCTIHLGMTGKLRFLP